ncbi:MAG: hypothetical protein E7390_00245 [Ruminococcaceae bacterium]|nr:hypothetical protein [Oscillospiraceae bacterium]
MLISTQPDSKGKAAALERARQLTEFRWTPVRDVPVYAKAAGKTVLPAGKEKQGMLYSSTEPTDKFITENISFETFRTIIANPDSALYTKDIGGHNNSWAYFGIVCNGLVRYALNIRRRYSTKRWPTIPGMRKVADEGKYAVEEIRLCDVLYAFGKGRNHVAFVTDILRDENGTVQQVEVSEAIRPVCVRRQFAPEAFYEEYKLFALWRYDFIDTVPRPVLQDAKTFFTDRLSGLPAIAVDYGDKTNYRTHEDVVISTFCEGENEIEICCEGKQIEKFLISGVGKVQRSFPRGYYTVRHVKTDETVCFCVTEPEISHSVQKDEITIKADACDSESRILYMEFREKGKAEEIQGTGKDDENSAVFFYSDQCASLAKVEELTEEEKESGVFTRKIPEDAANFKVYFENKYGIWTHTMIKI